LVTTGLSWQASIGIIALGNFLIALAITANGIIGARLHIPYTIQSRAPFGFYFSFVVVFIRMLVGFFWYVRKNTSYGRWLTFRRYGVNTYTGAECVYAMLVAIWPSFAKLPNQLPASANISTKMMICERMPDFLAYLVPWLIILQHTWSTS
jgi:nucleobase:cation symporter-1, NCS1 family